MSTTMSMSPAQAAQTLGVSRMTIIRAIKSNELTAFRDNRNNWKIAPEHLQAWTTVHAQISEQKTTVISHVQGEVDVLKERLSAVTARAEAAESDRDAWRSMAEKLAGNRPRWRWPWR